MGDDGGKTVKKHRKQPHVWVIEVKWEYDDDWAPCAGATLHKRSASATLLKRKWRTNTQAPIRLTKYVRAKQ